MILVFGVLGDASVSLWGIPWDGTFVAALIAAAVSVIALVLEARRGRRADGQRLADRAEHAAERERDLAETRHRAAMSDYYMGINLMFGTNPGLVKRGAEIVDGLLESDLVDVDVKRLSLQALEDYTDPRSQKRR